jgi:sensor c-di-GMP phosphodiesterase-like protein
MIDMANRLGLNITAEGVEYSDQAEALAQLGCTEAQGFLWSKAVPAEEFVGWVLHGAPWRAPAAKLVE